MKKVNSIIEKIDKKNLCVGCGLCESICGSDNVTMKLSNDGFLHPIVKKVVSDKEKIIGRICPGVNIINELPYKKHEQVWGKIDSLYSSYSTDDEVRNIGSSGGTISGLAIWLLESNIVDKILQVGGDVNDYTRNTLQISPNKEAVLNCASSRYAPAHVFNQILEILEMSNDKFAFIGKPCDISALRNFLNEFPIYKNRFIVTISIICAGVPSLVGTENAINSFKPRYPINDLKYRGGGWPGNFSFKDNHNQTFKMSYNDSWGKILGRTVHKRCKICPDGIGLQADISVGDAWETKDGYPDFKEKKGLSLTILRTKCGKDIFENAVLNNVLGKENLDIKIIRKMQPLQYRRRKYVAARLLAFFILKKRMVKFKNLNIISNALYSNWLAFGKEFVGSLKRLNS